MKLDITACAINLTESTQKQRLKLIKLLEIQGLSIGNGTLGIIRSHTIQHHSLLYYYNDLKTFSIAASIPADTVELTCKEAICLLKTKQAKPFPSPGDTYFTYGPHGVVEIQNSIDDKYYPTLSISAYRTKDEAVKARNIALAKMRLKAAIAAANKNWTPSEGRYIHYFRIMDNTIQPTWSRIQAQPAWMCIKSEKKADRILKHYKDDIKLVLSE